ncbi:MAG TPA: winged helix-turn-helix domain-containing protein, partial [Deinococcales bacterium]|nr:winged helix-turn-helix domain-containing protein [Deinococcales bacterium]
MTDHLLARPRSETLDPPLHFDRQSSRPVARQLRDQLAEAIQAGRLPPGGRLPSTRALARALGVSRGAVLAAYEDLLADGYLTGRAGSGTFVSP